MKDLEANEIASVSGGCILIIPPAVVIAVAKFVLNQSEESVDQAS